MEVEHVKRLAVTDAYRGRGEKRDELMWFWRIGSKRQLGVLIEEETGGYARLQS